MNERNLNTPQEQTRRDLDLSGQVVSSEAEQPVPLRSPEVCTRKPALSMTALPLAVTLLSAFFAWALAHTVDHLKTLPLLRFTQIAEVKEDGTHLTFEFKNITGNVVFKNVNIIILGEAEEYENRFTEPETFIIGSGWAVEKRLYRTKDGIHLTLRDFHPGWAFRLETVMSGEGVPRVQLEHSDTPTMLERANWKSWLVEYQLRLIFLFGLGALMSVAVLAWKEWRQK